MYLSRPNTAGSMMIRYSMSSRVYSANTYRPRRDAVIVTKSYYFPDINLFDPPQIKSQYASKSTYSFKYLDEDSTLEAPKTLMRIRSATTKKVINYSTNSPRLSESDERPAKSYVVRGLFDVTQKKLLTETNRMNYIYRLYHKKMCPFCRYRIRLGAAPHISDRVCIGCGYYV